MNYFGVNIAISIAFIAMLAVIFNGGRNIIMIVISLELILLAVGIILVNLSFQMDDLIGAMLTLYLLPLAGAESAVALALLVAYYPHRGGIAFKDS